MITGILQAKRTFLSRGERSAERSEERSGERGGERSGVAKGKVETWLSFLIT